jgi:hypothetical protein
MKNDNFFMANVVKYHRDNILDTLFKNANNKLSRRKQYDNENRSRLMLSG